MRLLVAMMLYVGLLGVATPLHAREIRTLQPSSNWVLEYADDSCRLARSFGSDRDKVLLVVDQYTPGDSFRLMFAGRSVKPRNELRPINALLQFGPHEAEAEITVLTGTLGDEPVLFVEANQRVVPLSNSEKAALEQAHSRNDYLEPPPVDAAREKAATVIALKKVLRFDLVLETGSLGRPLAGLRDCSWDTVRTWGLDVAQQKSLTRKPHPKRPAHTWFNPDDYPIKLLRSGNEGIVTARLIVDGTGKPTSCHVQASTRPKGFDEVVCRSLLKKAQFDPARDAQGQPVPSYWQTTVNFRLQ